MSNAKHIGNDMGMFLMILEELNDTAMSRETLVLPCVSSVSSFQKFDNSRNASLCLACVDVSHRIAQCASCCRCVSVQATTPFL